MFKAAGFLLAAIAPACIALMPQTSKSPSVDFGTHIAPIVKARCLSCHNTNVASGGLDLSSGKSARKGGASGPIAQANRAHESLIWRRVQGLDELPRMPMGFKELDPKELARIKEWIESGASYEETQISHWAYVKPVRPTAPKVKNRQWIQTPIDSFVLANLEKRGLMPSARAKKATLFRRLNLDLTGLPPTVDELDSYLADSNPMAYEVAVDRLLKSPHFGENFARVWLDLGRYADTDGYEKDLTRSAWLFRDELIRMLNENTPYDRFSERLLAGDMLPNPTTRDLIASGFHRNTMHNLEGGVDQDEAMYEVINDRVATTSTVWMAQSLACARCHDHKYDPISQKDYFKMYAYFSNNEFEKRGDASISEMKYFEPSLAVPSPEQKRKSDELTSQIQVQEAELSKFKQTESERFEKWLRKLQATTWHSPFEKVTANGQTVPSNSGVFDVSGSNFPQSIRFRISAASEPISAVRLTVLKDNQLANGGPGRAPNGNFVLSAIQFRSRGKPLKVQDFGASHAQQNINPSGLFDDDPDTGWGVFPQYGVNHELIVSLETPVDAGNDFDVELISNSKQWPDHLLSHLKLETTTTEHAYELALPESLKALETGVPPAEELRMRAQEVFRQQSHETRAVQNRILQLKSDLRSVKQSVPTALILRERKSSGPLKSIVRDRGEFLGAGEEVVADIPNVLASPKLAPPTNRRELAKWLFRPDHPLTARVQVNRLWEHFFGRGIVESSDNFGTQGSPPTHPELLDWLATEYMRRNWNTKALIKLIVMSSTYQQSSQFTPKLLKIDPQNQLLGRGPRKRLEAEQIRDVALTASGLLDRKVGGPSVFPPQPDGVWNTPYSGETWKSDGKHGRYRRGLYTFWKRTVPYPAMTNFDAPSREVCSGKRTQTNTPLQSLTLLNDEAFFEAARTLGSRLHAISGRKGDPFAYGFKAVVARKPSESELNSLKSLFTKTKAKFSVDAEGSKKLGGSPEAAAWTMVANVLLNLDETITKE